MGIVHSPSEIQDGVEMKIIVNIVALGCILLGSAGCVATQTQQIPVEKLPPSRWVSIDLREGIDYERAFNSILDVLLRDFPLELADREIGYIKTEWDNQWAGLIHLNQKARISVKFSMDRSQIRVLREIKSVEGMPLPDVGSLNTAMDDLAGLLGRTAK